MSPFPKLYLKSLREKTINIIDSLYAIRREWKIEDNNFHIEYGIKYSIVVLDWTRVIRWLPATLGYGTEARHLYLSCLTFFEKCLWNNCVALHSNHYQKNVVIITRRWWKMLHEDLYYIQSLTFPVFNVSQWKSCLWKICLLQVWGFDPISGWACLVLISPHHKLHLPVNFSQLLLRDQCSALILQTSVFPTS